MRINPDYRSFGRSMRVKETSAPRIVEQKSFSEFMNNQEERPSDEELAERIKQIQLQGDRLSKSMTVRNLRTYKMMIKKFLEDTVRRGVSMKDVTAIDRRGRGKLHKIIDEIDTHLLEMADELLNSEQGRVQLLYRVGEIRGLLINITM
jgi:hypothetical protein